MRSFSRFHQLFLTGGRPITWRKYGHSILITFKFLIWIIPIGIGIAIIQEEYWAALFLGLLGLVSLVILEIISHKTIYPAFPTVIDELLRYSITITFGADKASNYGAIILIPRKQHRLKFWSDAIELLPKWAVNNHYPARSIPLKVSRKKNLAQGVAGVAFADKRIVDVDLEKIESEKYGMSEALQQKVLGHVKSLKVIPLVKIGEQKVLGVLQYESSSPYSESKFEYESIHNRLAHFSAIIANLVEHCK